jgi:hypothetical protein
MPGWLDRRGLNNYDARPERFRLARAVLRTYGAIADPRSGRSSSVYVDVRLSAVANRAKVFDLLRSRGSAA